jgi:RND superfamily putative drug exporter
MLERWTRFVYRNAKLILFSGVFAVVVLGIFGTTVFNHLETNGNDFQDPSSSSTSFTNISNKNFSAGQSQLLVLVKSQKYVVSSPEFEKAVNSYLSQINDKRVLSVQDYYTTKSLNFVSNDRHSTYVAISIQPSSVKDIYDKAQRAQISDGFDAQLGGVAAINNQITSQVTKDLKFAETLSFSILPFLLLFIFRGLVAAAVPLILGGLGILGTFFIMRILTSFTAISSYSINVITLLGLGLAIDYSLFVVSRFKEELFDSNPEVALINTMHRAGRTILFSGTTVVISFLGLLVFPQTFLRSMAIGGASVIAVTLLLSLTILPAGLAVLGNRINALGIVKRKLKTEHGTWYRFSHSVMKWPVFYIITVAIILLGLGNYFTKAIFTSADINIVPKNLSARQVNDALIADFNAGTEPVGIIVQTNGDPFLPANKMLIENYIKQISSMSGVNKVNSIFNYSSNSSFLMQAPFLKSYVNQNYFSIQVYLSAPAESPAAEVTVKNIRALQLGGGAKSYVGGVTAQLVDLKHSLLSRAPYAAAIIFSTTFILIFLLMGGIILPFKAIILDLLSLSAAFGVMVLIFQNGDFSFLGLTSLGSIDATSLVLTFAIAFGLSMDYEFFLLSRIKEEYEKTHDNSHSVAYGVEKTVGIITSAAILLVAVVGLFMTSKISLIQQIGLGLTVAVLLDSTLIRMILVPALMKIFGKWNWWAPRPLKAFYKRFGIKD